MLERGLQSGTNAAQAGVAFVGCEMAAFGEKRAPFQLAQGQSAGAVETGKRGAQARSGRQRPSRQDRGHPRALRDSGSERRHGAQAAAGARRHRARIRAMDEQGIDVEALSINPFWYKADRDVAREVIRIQNEKLAEFCASKPDRFVAFATAALQHPDLAVEQLVEGVKKLGLRGLSVGGSVNGQELADPKFHPVWAKAEELGVLVFIHPQGTAELEAAGRLKAAAGSRTSSAIRSRPRSRFRT